MGKEVSLIPPYMIWAAALPQGHGPTSTFIACRAWSGLTIHTDKTFKESHQEIPFTTWKNNTECKPHKIGFENLRAFFFYVLHAGLLFWTFCVFVLCSFYPAQLHTFSSAGQSVQLLPLFLPSQFEVWLFWGGWRCAVPLSAKACAAFSSWHAHGIDRACSLSPAWSDAPALYSI